MLLAGDRIKIFPETDVKSYLRWIKGQGYLCSVKGDEIVVGHKFILKYNAEELGKLIFKKRMKKKMSIGDFADAVEVTAVTVFDWEIGRKQPRDYNLKSIVEVLEISQEELEKCRI